jgi:predicted nucleic acid-binding protein
MINELVVNTTIYNYNSNTIIQAITIKHTYQLQFYDALIIATALENNCNILYSEDMHHNQLIENKLKIINSFI